MIIITINKQTKSWTFPDIIFRKMSRNVQDKNVQVSSVSSCAFASDFLGPMTRMSPHHCISCLVVTRWRIAHAMRRKLAHGWHSCSASLTDTSVMLPSHCLIKKSANNPAKSRGMWSKRWKQTTYCGLRISRLSRCWMYLTQETTLVHVCH